MLALAVDEALLLRIEQLEARVAKLEDPQGVRPKKAAAKPVEKN